MNEWLDILEQAERHLDDDDLFRKTVELGLSIAGVDDMVFANKLAVSRSTVARWKNGRAKPHPSMRRPVYAALRGLVADRN